MTDEPRMTDEEQTGQEDSGIETATGEGSDGPPDPDAGAAAAAAAQEGREAAIEGVKSGDEPPQSISSPHGHEGDYDPIAEAEKLPPPPEPEEGESGAADGPLDL